MTKEEIRKDDILVFVTGQKSVVGSNTLWVLSQYYDDNLCCLTNSNFNIVKVYRPQYELIFDKEQQVTRT